jgi:hypothetical protein
VEKEFPAFREAEERVFPDVPAGAWAQLPPEEIDDPKV